MNTPRTPEEILAALTNPKEICAAEYASLHDLITDGLPDVWSDRESDDDARRWAISVCEESIAHAKWIIQQLSR
jgi:hypothetical protein